MAGELQFAAFLSYSRRDVRLARWLVRSLEEFRLPRQTVEDLKARNAAFIAARPVFRDEHDMPVGGVISDRLSEVLDASATMIVLCTTASVKSEWVNREIELFANRHPDRRIIPAVAEGEPDSDASYPPALLKLGKPLAADVRNPPDRRLSVIKIAAAVLGLDVDQLVGRVQKHRAEQRRLFAAVGGAAAAVVVGLGATAGVMASNAKQANDRAYAQVEQLLTKTRADMDDLAAKKALHEAAKLYFDSKAGNRLSDRDLLLKAEWLRQEGQDAGLRNASEQALAYRQDAYAITSELLKRNPENAEFLFSHAQSAYWMGDYYYARAQPDIARPFLEGYAQAADRLMAIAPDYANPAHSTDARSEVYYAQVNLGVLALEKERDPRAAEAAFSNALRTLDPHPQGVGAKLNLSRSHLQRIDALAQFASASEVMGVVHDWEPLLLELEGYRDESNEVDFHVANSWGMIVRLEDHLPRDLQLRSQASQQGTKQKPKRDPDNAVLLSLAAEIDLEDAGVDCRTLPSPATVNVKSKPELGLVSQCLRDLPVSDQIALCSSFANAFPRQPGLLDQESSWASLLSSCSRSVAKAGRSKLSTRLEEIAAAQFFTREPEQMRLRTQFALARFETQHANNWINNLKASLDRRGWISKGGD